MLLVRALDERPPFAEQDEALVTYAEKIDRRGPHARPGAPGERARARRPRAAPRTSARASRSTTGRSSACCARTPTASALVLDEVQPPGGRPMAFADWARGRPEQAAALGLGGAGGVSVSPARRAAHTVVVRTLESGAYADRALHSAVAGPGAARPRARQAPGVRRRAAARHARLDLRPLRQGQARRPASAPRCTSAWSSCCSSTGSPTTRRSTSRSSWPSRAPGTGSSTRCCAASSARASSCPRTTRPAGAAIRHAHPQWLDRAVVGLARRRPHARAAARPTTSRPSSRCGSTRSPATSTSSDIPGTREGETIVVDGPFDLFAHPAYAAGAITPQSRAAQRVGRFTDPAARASGCSTSAPRPGGKTTHLAALMGGEGEVVAVERHEGRAAALERTCERTHAAGIVRVVTADARTFRDEARFDRVLLDPPCSGLGTLQAHPDLRWRVQPDDLAAARRRAGRAARGRAREPAARRHARLRGLHAQPGRGTPAERRLLAHAAVGGRDRRVLRGRERV